MALKEELHRNFSASCNVNAPPGQYLFDELSKHTKEIAEANKISKRVSSAGSTSLKQWPYNMAKKRYPGRGQQQ